MHVFTYGSLMFPEVWQRVVRGSYRSAVGSVDGCRRHAIAGEIYPGMVREAGSSVRGVVHFDVDSADLLALDLFEGQDYVRETVEVRLENGETVLAGAYFYRHRNRLLDEPWEPDAFQMQRFIDTYCRERLGN
jgi:gamma-glutamylcyclotransferase (GGCT)/AIG2-like uncharacterized protein YtfP